GRMTIRLAPSAPINDPTSPYRPNLKAAHRADPQVLVDRGSHGVFGDRLETLPGVFPIEVLHFPVRTARQMLEKHTAWWNELGDLGGRAKYTLRGGPEATDAGGVDGHYAALAVDGVEQETGLGRGVLV